MTLAIALIGTDGIVMASDSRRHEIYGELEKATDDVKKLWILEDGKTGLMLTHNNLFAETLKGKIATAFKTNYEDIKDKGILAKSDIISKKILRKEYDIYSKNMPSEVLCSASWYMEFCLVGYTAGEEPLPRVMVLNSRPGQWVFAPRECSNYYSIGVAQIAEYLIRKLYDYLYYEEEGIIKAKEKVNVLKNLAVMVIDEVSLASPQTVGGAIQMFIVRPDGATKIETTKTEQIRKCIRQKITDENNLFKKLKAIET